MIKKPRKYPRAPNKRKATSSSLHEKAANQSVALSMENEDQMAEMDFYSQKEEVKQEESEERYSE